MCLVEDMLANMGSEDVSGIEFYANPHLRMVQIVEDDFMSISFPWLVFM
jgi:hypothetical protein